MYTIICVSRSTPLYQQVRERLLERISSGELAVGDRLEPEVELALEYDVSRATMRNAIRDLVQNGLLTRRPGVGTMVVRSAPEVRSTRLDSLIESVCAGAEQAQLLVLDSSLAAGPAEVTSSLGLDPDARLLKVLRLCKSAGEPIALSTAWIPASLGISAAEALVAPVYDLIERTYRTPISFGKDSVGALAAAGTAAKLLDVKAGTPLVSVDRVAYAGNDEPVLACQALFRADRYRYEVTLPRAIEAA